MKIYVYPNIIGSTDVYFNEYLKRLYAEDIEINEATKIPQLQLFLEKPIYDIDIFNWIENTPDYRIGLLQSLAAFHFIRKIKRHGKKIVWYLHNKRPHKTSHLKMKERIMRFMAKQSDLIITYAQDGVDKIKNDYPEQKDKVKELHFPTTNRMTLSETERENVSIKQDLLIWGSVQRRKNIPQFLKYLNNSQSSLKIKIIGKCNSEQLEKEIKDNLGKKQVFENCFIDFDKLEKEIAESRFVFVPYAADSVLSSATLVDSLSLGGKVIGPNSGSFKEYMSDPRIKVYTYNDFSEVEKIVKENSDKISVKDYADYLAEYSWDNYIKHLKVILESL